jgi:hypothetical protein
VTLGSHVTTTTTTKKKARGKSGHAQNLLPVRDTSGQGLFRSRDFVTSGQKAPTRADIVQLPVAHAQNILPDMVTSGHVTNVSSGHVTSGHVTSGCSPLLSLKCVFVRAHILLILNFLLCKACSIFGKICKYRS